MTGFAYLIGAFVANGVANVLLKLGADKGVHLDWSLGIGRLFSLHAFLIAGVALFAVNVLLYIAALRSLPLSLAYPVMVAMSFVIVNSAAFFLLNERVSSMQLLGYALIIAGVVCVVGFVR